MHETMIKILSAAAAVTLAVVLTLAASRVIGFDIFWITAALIGGFAYWVLPRLKNK